MGKKSKHHNTNSMQIKKETRVEESENQGMYLLYLLRIPFDFILLLMTIYSYFFNKKWRAGHQFCGTLISEKSPYTRTLAEINSIV